MSFSVYKQKSDCCGCSACMNICPKGAITMQADGEGFLYPSVNSEKCTECGLCIKSCDFQAEHTSSDDQPPVYAVKASDDIRKLSTSGGVFTVLSDFVLSLGGTVYGAAYTDNLKVVHTRAVTVEQRNAQRGSKYVQSELSDTFKQIKADLANGQHVLFSGTSCQVAGLKSYLRGVDTQKLLLIDILCHGVPSPAVFADYIALIEKERGKKVAQYHTRAKDKGYRFNEKIVYTDGSCEIKTRLSEVWSDLYYSLNALRPSCYNCKYVGTPRVSDITIADFWGIENVAPDFYDDRGVSLTVINTDKGRDIFDAVRNTLTVTERTFKEATVKNPNLLSPSKAPATRADFWREYEENGARCIFKTYGGYNAVKKIKHVIKKILGRA